MQISKTSKPMPFRMDKIQFMVKSPVFAPMLIVKQQLYQQYFF